MYARSTADVYVRAEDAHEAVSALRTDARRCTEVVDKQYGRRYRGTREVAPPRTTAADEVYAGTQPAGLFKSKDAGRTWQEIDTFAHAPGAEQWCVPTTPPSLKHDV